MFFLFLCVKFQQRWNVINIWPLKNNAILCRDGTIPGPLTPVSFCYGLLIYLFIIDRRVSKVSTKHTLCVILTTGWFMPLPFSLSLPLFVTLYLFLLIVSVCISANLWCRLESQICYSLAKSYHMSWKFLGTLSLWSSSGKYRGLQG